MGSFAPGVRSENDTPEDAPFAIFRGLYFTRLASQAADLLAVKESTIRAWLGAAARAELDRRRAAQDEAAIKVELSVIGSDEPVKTILIRRSQCPGWMLNDSRP